jgi:uncharacterized OB-fold protein
MTATDNVRADEGATSLPAPPTPVIDVDTAPFWESLERGEFSLCRCTECRAWLQPPLERCRYCAGPTTFERAAGRGIVHSYIVVRNPSVPAFAHLLPYAIVLVELAEGVRLSGRYVGDLAEVRVGLEVRARTERLPHAEHTAVVYEAAPGDCR